jgi:large subunit ribosomal protein L4
MKVDVKTLDARAAGSIELDPAIFGLEPRKDILERVVRWQMAKRQAGTHDTKTRSEVNRTKSKMYKQKGTGQARHASANAPIFRGGGRAHGPKPRSHAHDLPKKVRALGLKHALSAKAGAKAILVIDDARLAAPKTKALKDGLAKLGVANALLIGGKELDANLKLAARNIPNFDVLPSAGANVYDILRRHTLVLTKEAVAELNARLSAPVTSEAAPVKKSRAKKADAQGADA